MLGRRPTDRWFAAGCVLAAGLDLTLRVVRRRRVERWLIDATIAGSVLGIPAWIACLLGAALTLAT